MKRFYKTVGIEPVEGGHTVLLDDRMIKTQGGHPLTVPTEALALLLAAEWRDQGETIDPRGFPQRDRADYAIDVIAGDPTALVERLLRYAETDTLCYRADPDEALYRRQRAMWEPVLQAFEKREGVTMERVSGVLPRPLDTETRARLRARLEALDPFTLAALEALTSLSASLSIGMTALEPEAHIDALWEAANLEEDWQTEQWGEDAEAAERRAARKTQFLSAAAFAKAVTQNASEIR